jgi:hypothetical protein
MLLMTLIFWAGGPASCIPQHRLRSCSNTTALSPLRVKILKLGCPVLDAFQGRDFWPERLYAKDQVVEPGGLQGATASIDFLENRGQNEDPI